MPNPLRVAVQMDPMESINIAGDSSFALMLSAQDRGHEIFHYDVRSLSWRSDGSGSGRVTAWAAPVTVRKVKGDHFDMGEHRTIDLGSDVDVVLMRQDPPFDIGYLTGTWRLKGETLVVNDPVSVRNAPEKVYVLDFARFMPPTLITRRIEEVRGFIAEHGAVVIKPLHSNGGKARAPGRVPGRCGSVGCCVGTFVLAHFGHRHAGGCGEGRRYRWSRR